jgi:hypothetical protein
MAERRMFAKSIIDSDAFLEMPISAQLLYFHLCMRADDEGFINKPKSIMRIVGCKDDDMRVLLAKNFVIPFESGVVVIKHWKIHNYIRGDRLQPTEYTEEKACLSVKENKSYTLCQSLDGQLSDTCPSSDSIGKDRLGKDSIGEVSLTISDEIVCSTSVERIVRKWNDLGLKKITKIVPGTNRYEWLKKRIKDYGEDSVIEAIENVGKSDFLMGRTAKAFNCTFDWFIRPNNFPKVLDGNYSDSKTEQSQKTKKRWVQDDPDDFTKGHWENDD